MPPCYWNSKRSRSPCRCEANRCDELAIGWVPESGIAIRSAGGCEQAIAAEYNSRRSARMASEIGDLFTISGSPKFDASITGRPGGGLTIGGNGNRCYLGLRGIIAKRRERRDIPNPCRVIGVPEASCEPSGEKAMLRTRFWWP